MGRIYNIHPDSAGSIIDAVALAGRIRELGGRADGWRRQPGGPLRNDLAAAGGRGLSAVGGGYGKRRGI